MKFSGPVQLLTSNFWARVSDQPASRVRPWAENGLFLENLSPPSVFINLFLSVKAGLRYGKNIAKLVGFKEQKIFCTFRNPLT